MPYKKILIALECRDEENKVITEAIRLADALNAELSAFHVNDPAAGKAHMMMDTPCLGSVKKTFGSSFARHDMKNSRR